MELFILRPGNSKEGLEKIYKKVDLLYPDAVAKKAPTKIDALNIFPLIRDMQAGDTVIFESVNKMAADKDEACDFITDCMFSKKIKVHFLFEPYFNSDSYLEATSSMQEDSAKRIIQDLLLLQLEKYFDDKSIGKKELNRAAVRGPYEMKAAVKIRKTILMESQTFHGTKTDAELIRTLGIGRNTFYKYKREVKKANGLILTDPETGKELVQETMKFNKKGE